MEAVCYHRSMRRTRYQFRDNRNRAVLAMAGLYLCAALNLVDFLFYAFLRFRLGDEDLGDFTEFETVLGYAHLAALIGCAVVFILWLRRAYENAAAAGMRLRHSLGYSIGGWFIPFANLWIPPQIVGDTYRHAMGGKGNGVIGLWWMTFLVSRFVGNFSNNLMATARSYDSVAKALMVGMASDVLAITAAVCAVWIVRKTTAMARVLDPGVADVFGEAAAKR
jgi:hypothetical protein